MAMTVVFIVSIYLYIVMFYSELDNHDDKLSSVRYSVWLSDSWQSVGFLNNNHLDTRATVLSW